MEASRPCGCKGCRTCLLCEAKHGIVNQPSLDKQHGTYVYCLHCAKAWPGWDMNLYKEHPHHTGAPIDYPGVYIDLNFLSDMEEHQALEEIKAIPWYPSQSGRRKQNFGPKCNFKKKKLKLGEFQGFPKELEFIHKKLWKVPVLHDFQTIEQCTLEYDPKRGASIDPHVDDCWVWGERIVTVNLLSSSVLTMTINNKLDAYNLSDVETYPSVMKSLNLEYSDFREMKENVKSNENATNVSGINTNLPYKLHRFENAPIVRIPMPRKSLLVLYGAPRYDWEHRILREDITQRRVCLAYREFTPSFLKGGNKSDEGAEVLKKARQFF